MDLYTKTVIQKAMDDMIIEKGDIIGVLEPFLENIKIESLRDFAIGYLIGGVKAIGGAFIAAKKIHDKKTDSFTISDEDKHEINQMIIKRLPDILERIGREQGR